jgi:two-component system response regulator FixJ
MSVEQHVFIVDDDEAVRESLAALLESHGFSAFTFPSALHFLAHSDRRVAGCLLSDVRMPEMDGLELQEKVAAKFPDLAVVIITGHGDVPLAVRAMKAGATDFIEKPFTEDVIIDAVRRALQQAAQSKGPGAEIAAAAASRLTLLSPREREVLEGLVAGLPNKTIAYDLGISSRTVEIHRARVMEKMRARSLSALVRLALAAGIVPTG